MPKVGPRWNIKKLESKALEFYRAYLKTYLGQEMTQDLALELYDLLSSKVLLIDSSSRVALKDLLISRVGQTLGIDVLRYLAYQLVYHKDKVGGRRYFQSFTGVDSPRWLPLQIDQVELVNRGKFTLLKFKLFILDSEFAGDLAQVIMSKGRAYHMSREMGFNRKVRYREPSDLLGMRFEAEVKPSSSDEVDFFNMRSSSSMLKHNKGLIKALDRKRHE